jgi:Carbohydrate binding module (family 6)/Glycosyl hydrolases family 28
MVSMDGANISDVHYRDITVSNVASPIMQKIGTRRRCGDNPGIGHISNITYDNINITGKSSPQYTATLWGESGGNHIDGVSFNNVNITVPGGSGNLGTGVPSNDPNNYNPNSIGTRPAYGWYIHNANNIKFTNSSVRFASDDARPAVIANTGSTVQFDHFTAQRSTGSTDLVFQTISGYCVSNSTNTSGGALRISATTDSTQVCVQPPPPPAGTRYEAENAACQGTVDSDHAGFSGTGFCNTTNSVGASVQWTATAASAGAATLTFRYANGTTASRPMDLSVNGVAVGTLDFPPTGSFDTWATVKATATLAAGSNTIRLAATTSAGGPNLDYVDVAMTSPVTRYEAENAACDGTIDADHTGFSGTGFCNTTNAVGASVQWTVNASAAGNAQLGFRYSNGTTTSRPAQLTVNGAVIGTLDFPPTASWDTWVTVTVTAPLVAGSNTVRLAATTAAGAPNLDYLEVG